MLSYLRPFVGMISLISSRLKKKSKFLLPKTYDLFLPQKKQIMKTKRFLPQQNLSGWMASASGALMAGPLAVYWLRSSADGGAVLLVALASVALLGIGFVLCEIFEKQRPAVQKPRSATPYPRS